MKLILFLTILLTASFCIGQTPKNHFFWPDGKPFITEQNNVKSHNDSLGIADPHTFSYKNTTVFFYPLSAKPAYALTENKSEIPAAIKAYKPYLYPQKKFRSDLARMVESQLLDTTYCKMALGKPDLVINNSVGHMWMYKKRQVSLFLDGELVKEYEFYLDK